MGGWGLGGGLIRAQQRCVRSAAGSRQWGHYWWPSSRVGAVLSASTATGRRACTPLGMNVRSSATATPPVAMHCQPPSYTAAPKPTIWACAGKDHCSTAASHSTAAVAGCAWERSSSSHPKGHSNPPTGSKVLKWLGRGAVIGTVLVAGVSGKQRARCDAATNDNEDNNGAASGKAVEPVVNTMHPGLSGVFFISALGIFPGAVGLLFIITTPVTAVVALLGCLSSAWSLAEAGASFFGGLATGCLPLMVFGRLSPLLFASLVVAAAACYIYS